MDAVNIDLKGFTDEFYHRVCGADLAAVLETIEYVATRTDTWLELTTLVIPGHNDSEPELDAMTRWVVEHCGPDVPMHFSAFHPDWKMRDVPATPPATLTRARAIAMANGVRYAYTGNVHDREGDTTSCPGCHRTVIERDWYDIRAYRLDDDGRCSGCGTPARGGVRRPGREVGSQAPAGAHRRGHRVALMLSLDRAVVGTCVARAGSRPAGGRRLGRSAREVLGPGRGAARWHPRASSGRDVLPGQADRLAEGVDRYVAEARQEMAARAAGTSARGVEAPRATAEGRLVAVVVPHAGHVYSGPTAAFAYAAIDPSAVDRVVLLGPAHYVPVDGIGLSTATAWRTPLGDVELDGDLAADLQSRIETVVPADSAHAPEHSLEVQLPFLQRVLAEGWRLVPADRRGRPAR